MSRSHPSVHPVNFNAPPSPSTIPLDENDLQHNPPTRIRMKELQGMPGTSTSLALRSLQFSFAVVSLAVMATTSDFPSVTAFRYLVAAVSLQTLWSLSLGVVDIYALLVKRCLRNSRVIALFTMGDGITCTLTFAAACASAGITILIGNDIDSCAQNHCTRFETATAMAFMSWFAVSPSFFLNFWSLASR
ncbi:hypothetical protein DCAR_0521863 [Daucus carota subsp. sativus]|uniref:CASP-like protein n=1 Tax=Daucus carota subsp. sativus TaxID=79200 RepID=A0AAF0X8N6_DAUCS|nr:PREDICTED: CASP-like protein 5A2 [Daucus carota subsp. sativus]WOH02474.1 hypothetical protein DCAR_0521863 [Daucus carota subsp. sativus]